MDEFTRIMKKIGVKNLEASDDEEEEELKEQTMSAPNLIPEDSFIKSINKP